MQFNEMPFPDAIPVDGYGPGFFRVAGKVHEGAMRLIGAEVSAWGGYDDAAALTELAGLVDFVVIGTGEGVAHIPAGLRAVLDEAGIGVEVMATPTACRTFNVLASEGRRVALAVLPV